MAYRYIQAAFISIVAILLLETSSSDAAPAFKFKKIYTPYGPERFPSRSERRLVGGPSPVHFITPFMGVPQSMNSFNNFFAPPPPLGNPSSSSVYKLPLRLFSNGKPSAVFHGVPKPQNAIDYLPQAVSKVIRLPLKYISNAKPIGIYFKDPSRNYL